MNKAIFNKIKEKLKFLERIKSIYIIYAIAGILSLVLIGLFFINTENPWCIVSCSIGSSGIGAVLIAIFIEIANCKEFKRNRKVVRFNQLKILKALMASLLQEMAIYVFEQKKLIDKQLGNESLHENKLYYISFDNLLRGLYQLKDNDKKFTDVELNQIKIDISIKANSLLITSGTIVRTLKELNHTIKIFEVMEFFTSTEIRYLKSIEYCFDIITTKDNLISHALNIAFESLLKIEEFKKLKNIKFYYKNGNVAIEEKIDYLGIGQNELDDSIEIVFDNKINNERN